MLSTGATQSLVISTLTGGLSEAEIAKRRAALAALKVHPRDDEANIALIARIERWYAMARGEDRDRLQEMLNVFKIRVEAQNLSDIEALRARISADLDSFEAGYVR